MSDWLRHDAPRRTLLLTLHIQPGAKASSVAGLHGDALKVRIAAPAVDNKANDALLAYLRSALALPAGALELRQGATSRRKVVAITGADEALLARVRTWAAE